jgi:hypothetical protein
MDGLIYKSLENIIPLLLTLLIIAALLYFFIKKITSPFSRIGNLLWDKSSAFFDKIAQERKRKLQRQIEKLNIKITDLETRDSAKTKYLLEIKDKLNDVSKRFTLLNESELQKTIFSQSIEDAQARILVLKNSKRRGVVSNIKDKMKIRALATRAKKAGLLAAKNDSAIKENKQSIKALIDELLASLKSLDIA